MDIVTNSIELGEKLKILRRDAGLTQEALANKLGIDRSTYSYYEKGRITPSLFTLINISRIYNKDLTEIISSL